MNLPALTTKILLAEDDNDMRRFLVKALQNAGYDVASFDNGLSAYNRLREEPFELLLTDIVMPEMDGPTMFGELRKRGITAKVIFVSGYAEDAFAKNLPDGEEFGFLPKPFTLKQLVEAVKAAVG
jgi:two-component system cell cycle sensor histidine kinase/response regulator CckA